MLEIFQKKRFLVDYLENFVDMHNHILPGIDDGAKNEEEAIEMISGLKSLGIKKLIATPHIMHNYYDNTPHSITESYERLRSKLFESDLSTIVIETAAEHMIDDQFETLLDEKAVMPIKNDYLLIEMSCLQPPINFDAALNQITGNGYFPILAHPERYLFIKREKPKYGLLKKKGLLFQLNMLSLSDYYGNEVKKKAWFLLQNGLIDIIATDLHHTGHIQALKEIKLPNRVFQEVIPVIRNTIEKFY